MNIMISTCMSRNYCLLVGPTRINDPYIKFLDTRPIILFCGNQASDSIVECVNSLFILYSSIRIGREI